MAFNFLNRLRNLSSPEVREEDEGSPVDEEEGDVDAGSDIEFECGDGESGEESDGTEGLDLDLDLDPSNEEQNGPFPWSSTLHNVEVELFTQRTGPNLDLFDLDYTANPIDFFHLYILDSFMKLVADQTNLYATQVGAPASFKTVTPDDISKYFYINMMFGIHKLPSYLLYWSSDPLLRVSAVAEVMSRNRYQTISRFFHLSDRDTFIPRGEEGHDPLHKIKPALDLVLRASQMYYSPGAALSIDEAMIPFQGRLYFKQYIKGKPNPWGVKVWCLCDAKNGYLCDFSFYTGKENTPMPKGLGHHVVMSLGSRFLYKFHHFYFDNFFSSVQLAHDLLERSTYSCATVRVNRKHWPSQLKGNIKPGECFWRQFGNIIACWWRDKRPLFMISTNASPTMSPTDRRTKEGVVQKDIPQPVLYYNSNMGGVDMMDQFRSYYKVGRKSHKWWRSSFWFLFEVALIIAYILYKNMPRPNGVKPMNHFNFHLEVARALCKGVSKPRTAPEAGPAAAGIAAPNPTEHKRARLLGRKKQCYMCRSKDIRTASGRHPETVFGCFICKAHLCDDLCFAQFHEKIQNN